MGRWGRLTVLSLVAACSGPAGGGDSGMDATAPPLCARFGRACSADADCCSSRCLSGICICGVLGETCQSDDECCSEPELPGACVAGLCARGLRSDGSTCSEAVECIVGNCESGVCGPPRCNAEGERCLGTALCCGGLSCDYAAGCLPECLGHGEACEIRLGGTDDCCSGFDCDAEHGCQPICHLEGSACGPEGPYCCEGMRCMGTACEACGAEGDACGSDEECCAPSTCEAGTCACSAPSTCTEDAQCCAGQLCIDGSCRCADLGDRCRTGGDCCSGEQFLVCRDEQCRGLARGTGAPCIDGSDCYDDGCVGGACCTPIGGRCSDASSCCPGTGQMVCAGGLINSECQPCRRIGEGCFGADECCSGLGCGDDDTCCKPRGTSCSASEPCCAGDRCEGGACCGVRNEPCTSDADCCASDGLICDPFDRFCTKPAGAACTTVTDCSGGVGRWDCADGMCCVRGFQECLTGAECCSGDCVGGRCGCSDLGERCSSDCCNTMQCDWDTDRCCARNLEPCTVDSDCCDPAQTCQRDACRS